MADRRRIKELDLSRNVRFDLNSASLAASEQLSLLQPSPMRPMNTHRPILLAAVFAVVAIGAMGCTIATHPAQVSFGPAVHTTHVVQQTAPTRVYHNGTWLHYRSDGYYYRSGSSWHVAHAVPTHVHSYHRPGRPTHVTSHGARPTHVVAHPSRPTHVRTTGRPTARPSARPTRVRRTVRPSSSPSRVRHTTSNRRTYRR